MTLKFADKECGEGLPPLMLAEEGQANQGSFDIALKMIGIAAKAGADGIEFQLGLADDLYIKSDPGYKVYLRREFSYGQICDLVTTTKSKGLVFQAACLSHKLVDMCVKAGADSFCINAMDLNNPIMLDAVAASNRPFWLATLMCTIEEIDWAVSHLRRRGAADFGILHGQHVMGSDPNAVVLPEITQLDCITMFKERYKVPVGFVDHTPSVYMPAIAAAKGANIIMKHLAPQTNWRGPDWNVCLVPEDWKTSRDILRYAALTSGASKDLSQVEINDRKVLRRSLFTSRNLEARHVLAERDLVALRPSGGLDPKDITTLVGKKTRGPLKDHYMIRLNDLE